MNSDSRNNVSFLTRGGRQKTKYSMGERLAICGATEADLESFMELFCPGRPRFARTVRNSDNPRAWTTAIGRITAEEVAKHLVGNSIPGIKPCWVAPHSWEVTRWGGIDVDYRGDKEDFVQRCRKVRSALRGIGINSRKILVSKTPSGGRHYRFFFRQKVRVFDVQPIMSRIGLDESPGKIEIFPKHNKGMRLPFGFIPGEVHSPQKWVSFIRRFSDRKMPLVDWRKVEKLSQQIADKAVKDINYATPISQASLSSKSSPKILGMPRRVLMAQTTASRSAICSEGEKLAMYRDILSRPFKSAEEANTLWGLGIRCPGTRTECTKRLAWHLIHIRKQSPDVAATQLVNWVYSTGKTTSTDVMSDLMLGTRKVEQQVRDCVSWMSTKTTTPDLHFRNLCGVSREEIDAVLSKLGNNRFEGRIVSAALHMLRYAKLHGVKVDGGWNFALAINSVVRKWPECRNRKNQYYKPVMDAFIKCGLLVLTRDSKRTNNRTGRARSYKIVIDPSLRLYETLTHERAMKHVTDLIKKEFCSALCLSLKTDTYKLIYNSTSKNLRFIMEVEQTDSKTKSRIVFNKKKAVELNKIKTVDFRERERLAFERVYGKSGHSSIGGINGERVSQRSRPWRPQPTNHPPTTKRSQHFENEAASEHNESNRRQESDYYSTTLGQSWCGRRDFQTHPHSCSSVKHENLPLPATPPGGSSAIQHSRSIGATAGMQLSIQQRQELVPTCKLGDACDQIVYTWEIRE